MNPNHTIERAMRDCLKAHWPHGHPRVSRGVADRGGFYSAIDIGNESHGNMKTLPMTLVSSSEAESILPGLANYRVQLTVTFISNPADNTLAQHEAFANEIGKFLDGETWIDWMETNGRAVIYTPFEASGSSLETNEIGHWATNWEMTFVFYEL